ncbi:hypothetical protein M0C40_05545 [Spiroplasma citri]|uniref:Plectrovirus-related protein n=1 Tax=Spiroplasma citri TaxID=2133 RepID=A0AAX3SWB9_SPICI|nr:hypothetical protein [Spiroplasma citri]WFG95560.1 hypothetical protein M0C40_05545 [Spiroplasma citri]
MSNFVKKNQNIENYFISKVFKTIKEYKKLKKWYILVNFVAWFLYIFLFISSVVLVYVFILNINNNNKEIFILALVSWFVSVILVIVPTILEHIDLNKGFKKQLKKEVDKIE